MFRAKDLETLTAPLPAWVLIELHFLNDSTLFGSVEAAEGVDEAVDVEDCEVGR